MAPHKLDLILAELTQRVDDLSKPSQASAMRTTRDWEPHFKPQTNFTVRQWRVSYSTLPTPKSLETPRQHCVTLTGLNELDVRTKLAQKIRKRGRYLHLILEIEAL